MDDDSSLTHADLARAAGVSVTTIKSYRSKFPGCFPVVRSGKPLRFAARAQEACLAIREGFDQGLSVEELRERLRLRFPWSWRHPRAERPVISADLEKNVQDMAATLVRLTQAQAAMDRRLTHLEEAVAASGGGGADAARSEQGADADVEARLLALRRDFDALREALAAVPGEAVPVAGSGPDPAAAGPKKIVRIRGSEGGYERFALQRLAPDAEGSGAPQDAFPDDSAAPAAPGDATLDLPLTVHSTSGEFLGLAGPGGHLTVRGFMTLMARHLRADPAACTWSGTSEGRLLHIPADPPHSLAFRETTTPKGNQVALVVDMRMGDEPLDSAGLVALLRSLRKELDQA